MHFIINIYEQLLLKPHFQNPSFLRSKNTFEPNVFKWVIKKQFINASPFSFLIINVKFFFNFQKEWCTFGRKKKTFEKNKDCPLLIFECFKHVKIFSICVKP